MGHHLLEHSFENVVLGDDHKRQFDKIQEKQALFISAELLIPESAARNAAFANWDNARIAQAYNVSEQFAQMRMMGVRVIAQRAANKYRRKS
jgi:Zn-dependent peptidase ImmA (M78 family)